MIGQEYETMIEGFNPCPKPETKEKAMPKRIRQRSKKLSREEALYRVESRDWYVAKCCEHCGSDATEVHHKKGRGILLRVVEFWMAVCRECHQRIEREPNWAKRMGYSINRGIKEL